MVTRITLGVVALAACLTVRPAWADGTAPIAARPIATGLLEPTAISAAPGDEARLFVVSKLGVIEVIDLETGTVLPEPFLDIRALVTPGGERGMWALAFSPEYATDGACYVSYSAMGDTAGTFESTIARYQVSEDPNVADPDSAVIIKVAYQSMSGHNAGCLQFGPDGMLYVSTGDDSTPAHMDADNNAQNLGVLHGKLLRLDLERPPDYIPMDNPFVGVPGARGEIFAYGLRNPWRFSFDALTHDLYVADVGWADREEINFRSGDAVGGENYGWRCMEGTSCTLLAGCRCDAVELTMPVLEISHAKPSMPGAVIGGSVYRGKALPQLDGRYFYSDYVAGFFRSFVMMPDGSGGYAVADVRDHTDRLNPSGAVQLVTSFGTDAAGELYFCSRMGTVWQIVAGCDEDLDHDGVVGVVELLAVLGAWGPCTDCAADLDGNGVVGVGDLLTLLGHWGPCG